MAIFHCSIKNISRSGGKSAVASAAYRAGEKLQDRETGLMHDYTRKNEVVYSEIFLCKNAPVEYQDRGTLWNAVEEIEKQSNARLAREWEVAIPNEISFEESKELVRGYAQSLANEGMCVDANIHWKAGNHHAHIMGTTRPIKENGEWGQKEKKAYKLDENGQKIPQIDEKTGKQKIGARGRKIWQREIVEANDWNKKEKVEEWRDRWAEHCNRYLGKEQQIDHRSFERQGIERLPTIHEGYVARQMEEKGQRAERCEINRGTMTANAQLDALEHQQNLLTRLLEQLKEKVKETLNERFRRLRTARADDDPAGRNAGGNRPIRANNSQFAGRSVAERLADLRSSQSGRKLERTGGGAGEADTKAIIREARIGIDSSRAREENSGTGRNTVRIDQHEKEIFTRSLELGEAQQPAGTGEAVGELLRSITAERSNQRSSERQSAEVRDYKVSQRENRDTVRERQRAEAERRAEAEEQGIAKDGAESQARTRR